MSAPAPAASASAAISPFGLTRLLEIRVPSGILKPLMMPPAAAVSANGLHQCVTALMIDAASLMQLSGSSAAVRHPEARSPPCCCTCRWPSNSQVVPQQDLSLNNKRAFCISAAVNRQWWLKEHGRSVEEGSSRGAFTRRSSQSNIRFLHLKAQPATASETSASSKPNRVSGRSVP